MLKAAVVGLGSMGRNHARVYRELDGVDLIGVADQNESIAEEMGRRYSAQVFTDYRKLIDEAKPDVVSLALPTVHHFECAMAFVDAGTNVLVEKPITKTVEQAHELVAAAKQKNVTLAVGHIERFNPAVRELRRRLDEGMAGRIYQAHARRLSPYPSRIQDSGVVVDLASHDIDLLRYLISDEIVRIHAETLRSINSDREDLLNGMIRFRNGAVGVLDVNWITPTKVRVLTITGARGMFRCDLLSQELFFFENESAPSQWDQLSILRGVSEGNVLGIRIQRYEPLMAELNDFVSAVREGRDPVVTGEDGTETLRLALEFVRLAGEHPI
jgi:UDP-N-acetylglucosamine 3-dehydrogenase